MWVASILLAPDVPGVVPDQVGGGEDGRRLEGGEEAVVPVLGAAAPEAEAVAELFAGAAGGAEGDGGDGGNVPYHCAVVLVAGLGPRVAPDGIGMV